MIGKSIKFKKDDKELSGLIRDKVRIATVPNAINSAVIDAYIVSSDNTINVVNPVDIICITR